MGGIEPLGIQAEERPDFRTQPEEWKGWLQRKKQEHYHATHKEVIEWGDEFIAPPEFFGVWIETKYLERGGLVFDLQRFQNIDAVSTDAMEDMVLKLGDILSILGDDVNWWSPHVIEIDDKGQCHLLACSDHSKYEDKGIIIPRTLDMILRIGTKRTIKIGETKDISIT